VHHTNHCVRAVEKLDTVPHFERAPIRAENSTEFTDTQCDIMPDRASTSGAEALARGPAASAAQRLRKTDPTNYIDTLNIEPIGLSSTFRNSCGQA
jgi:hypothetical protein